MTHMASQIRVLASDGRGSLRSAAQQAGNQEPAAAAHTGTQHAGPRSHGSASSGSLSDSLPDMSLSDMLPRPASAPSAAVQTLPAWPPLHPAPTQPASTMPRGTQVHMLQGPSVASLPVSSGQDAAAQTREQASAQLPAVSEARHAQDATAQVSDSLAS